MALVRSQVFIPVQLAPGTAIVPAGKRWLVKYALIYNGTGATSSYSIQVQEVGQPTRNVFAGSVANGATQVLPQPFTIAAGDMLVVSGASASLVVCASGIEFTP